MKKTWLVVLFFLALFPLAAGTITYVYRGSLSSIDLENPKRGNVYTSENGNIFTVSKVHNGAAMLDRIYTKTAPRKGDVITRRGPLHTLEAVTTVKDAGVRYSISSFLYPFRPVAEGGYSFYFKVPYVMGGLAIDLPLSKLVRSGFTIFEDASVQAHVTAGVLFTKTNCFAVRWGISYKLAINKFILSAGFSRSYFVRKNYDARYSGLTLSAGVRL